MAKIIINPIGGLANRMRCIASGITLARELNADYSIVWSVNSELRATFEAIFDNAPEISDHITYPNSIAHNLLYSIPRKKNLYCTKLSWARFGVAMHDGQPCLRDDGIVHEEARKCLLQGKDCFIQSGCIFYKFDDDLYRHLFKPSKEIENRILSKEHMVGIHIRRTDNIESIKHSPDELFINKIDEILQEKPETIFYLATDDTATKNKFKSIYGEKILMGESAADRNTEEGIKDAVTEMMILSRCSLIIGSYYSSFSEAAAMIGGVPFIQLYR